jgi:hypothetical protein
MVREFGAQPAQMSDIGIRSGGCEFDFDWHNVPVVSLHH